jgi:nicotinate-nucleotide adenylyltransferase
MARAALEQLGLEQLLFIPTGTQSYRQPPVASGEQRVAMLKLAIAGEPRFAVDKRELLPNASGYTVDTLKLFDKPWLLMGADQYEKLDSWHRPDEVRRLSRIAVFARPGFEVSGKVKTIAMTPTDVSATDIRGRVSRGEDISTLVPAPVATYIAENRLYR